MKILITEQQLKYIISEQYDSPEAKERFKNIPQSEINKMANIEPYKNEFNSNTFRGNDAEDLHNLIANATFKNKQYDAYASAEALYKMLIKEIPYFKKFKIDTTNCENQTHYLALGNEFPINDNTLDNQYSVYVELWLKYHIKTDKIMGEKKDKIYLLFSPHISPTKKSMPLFNLMRPNICSVTDEVIDDLLTNISKKMYGSPDDEDKYVENKYRISYNNLQLDSFIKILPKLKHNLIEFNRYVQNKYNISII